MRFVLCLADKREWDVDEFKSLGRSGINIRRRDLVCIACGGKAFFRKLARTVAQRLGPGTSKDVKSSAPAGPLSGTSVDMIESESAERANDRQIARPEGSRRRWLATSGTRQVSRTAVIAPPQNDDNFQIMGLGNAVDMD